jgi:signal transduction histidine kinase
MSEEPIEVRRQRYVAGLLIRIITCGLFIIVFTVIASLLPERARPPFLPAGIALVLLILVNYPLWLVGRANDFPLEHFYVHWAVDLLMITLILHTLGGIDLPCGFGAYLIMVCTSAVFLSERAAIVIATASVILFDGLVILEGKGLIYHAYDVWDHHYTAAAQVITVLAANVFFYLFAFLVGSLSRQLKAVNSELRGARDELAKYTYDLEDNVRLRTIALERKNKEIEEFVHIVTHDLRNISTGVAELARRLVEIERGRLSDKGSKYAASIREDTRSLNQMLAHLLALFRSDHATPEIAAVNLTSIVEGVIKANATRINEKGIKIVLGNLPTVAADGVQLRHVLANLVENAIKYTGNKKPPTIQVECIEEARGYRLLVHDNGIGVPEKQRERIFQLYQRGTEQEVGGVVQEGAGIGLAIARRIVERWGGVLGVDSLPGEGSTFYVTIPKLAVRA